MGMTYRSAAIWIAVIIVITILILYGPTLYKRERMTAQGYASKPPAHVGFPLNAPPLPLHHVASTKDTPGADRWCEANTHPCPPGMRIPLTHRDKYGGPSEEIVTASKHRDGF